MPLQSQSSRVKPSSFSQRLLGRVTLGSCFLLAVIAGGRYGLDALGFLLIPEAGVFCLGLFSLAALTLLVCCTVYVLKGLEKIAQPYLNGGGALAEAAHWLVQTILVLLASALALVMTLFFIFLLVLSNDWTRYEIEGKTYYQVRTPFWGDSCRQLEQAYLIFARDLGDSYVCWYSNYDKTATPTPPSSLEEIRVPGAAPMSAPETPGQSYSPAPLTPVEAENVTDIDESGTFGLVLANSNDIYAATYSPDQGHWLIGGKISTVGAKPLELCGHQRLSETVLVYCQARAEGATLLTSADNGFTWTTHELDPAASYLLEADYANGTYTLEVGYPAWVPSNSTTLITSSDGLTWQTR